MSRNRTPCDIITCMVCEHRCASAGRLARHFASSTCCRPKCDVTKAHATANGLVECPDCSVWFTAVGLPKHRQFCKMNPENFDETDSDSDGHAVDDSGSDDGRARSSQDGSEPSGTRGESARPPPTPPPPTRPRSDTRKPRSTR